MRFTYLDELDFAKPARLSGGVLANRMHAQMARPVFSQQLTRPMSRQRCNTDRKISSLLERGSLITDHVSSSRYSGKSKHVWDWIAGWSRIRCWTRLLHWLINFFLWALLKCLELVMSRMQAVASGSVSELRANSASASLQTVSASMGSPAWTMASTWSITFLCIGDSDTKVCQASLKKKHTIFCRETFGQQLLCNAT